MKQTLIALAVALAACTTAISAQAQTAKKKPAATKKATAKKAPAKKTAAKKNTRKKTATAKAKPSTPAPQHAAPTMVPDMAGGFPVFTGDFRCDEGHASITPQGEEFDVRVPGGRHYTMRRVPTSSGVVRLENAAKTAYWLQSGNKSMMIDTRAGGRVASDCRNAIQQAREDDLKANPTAGLLN
ncbi:MAG: hypothetical protein Q4A98_11310 [Comamonadaceae bacterium]|nr:hypothetical protein [Comamonadaceae bacterium]